MATSYRGFQLGLLPERKINKRALVTSYGLITLVILILINLSLILPEKLQLLQYHVTELIPMPSFRAEPAPVNWTPERRPTPLPPPNPPHYDTPTRTPRRPI